MEEITSFNTRSYNHFQYLNTFPLAKGFNLIAFIVYMPFLSNLKTIEG